MKNTVTRSICCIKLPWLIRTATLTLICALLAYSAWSFYDVKGILAAHMRAAQLLNSGEGLHIHFGVHLLSITLHRLSELSLDTSFYITLICYIILTFIYLYFSLHLLSKECHIHPNWILFAALALILMIVAPIGLPYIDERIYNFKWWNRSTLLWRNPTHTAVQPYAIIAFCYSSVMIRHYLNGTTPKTGLMCATALILFISALIKPSFVLTFIPTLGLIALNYYRREKRILHLGYVVAPTVLLMMAQYYFLFEYNPIGKTRSMFFAPYKVWTWNNTYPLPSLLLATAFPLYICIVRYRHLQFFSIVAALNFIIAIMPYALLKETGDRDFEWGYWYGLQILFLATSLELYKWWKNRTSKKDLYLCGIGVILLLLHTAFGVAKFASLYPFAIASAP